MKWLPALHPQQLRRGLIEWMGNDGINWIYIFKVLTAAFVTYWLTLRLECPQPRTALVTVFIVMQPQSGSVIAKGVYRALGTIAGLIVAVTLVAVFGQQGDLFLTALALWIGICCFCSAVNRNFRAYGFVLAGYTAAIVGLPALAHPSDVFNSACWRAIEVSLGIICSTFVSAIIFPQSSGNALHKAIKQRFDAFSAFAVEGLRGMMSTASFEASNKRFASETVMVERLRSESIFEDPLMYVRSSRLSRLNSEFMTSSTRFNALYHLLERLRLNQSDQVINVLQRPLYNLNQILTTLSTIGQEREFADRLEKFKTLLSDQLHESRQILVKDRARDDELLDLTTAYELLYRFCDELHSYVLTAASLKFDRDERENWSESFQQKTNVWVALAAGIRGTVTVSALAAFWASTAWPSGVSLMLSAAASVSLAAATPNPQRTAMQMGIGAFIASVAAFLEMFWVFPAIDGFALLCLALAPVLILGTFLTTRVETFGIGLGTLIVFALSAIPDNLTVYDPYTFLNDNIATILGMLVGSVAGAVVLPPNARWLWRHLERELRKQVAFAANGPLQSLKIRFESETRDLLHYASGLAAARKDVQRDLIRWHLTVQQIGHTIIELRLATALDDNNTVLDKPTMETIYTALTNLFQSPNGQNLGHAVTVVEQALAAMYKSGTGIKLQIEGPALDLVISYLHFLRTSLLDPHSPFVSLVPVQKSIASTSQPSGAPHAS